MQVVLDGAVRSVVSSRGAAGSGDLVVSPSPILYPDSPSPIVIVASYLIDMTAGLRNVGVLLAAALPCTDIVSKVVFSIVIFARSSVSRVSFAPAVFSMRRWASGALGLSFSPPLSPLPTLYPNLPFPS